MRHPEFPAMSFLMVPLLLVSLPSHIRARYVSTISLVIWLGLFNIIRGVNSLVWANNTTIRLLVWCDITTKFEIGFTFAIPLTALCISRHLEHVSSNRQATITRGDKRRRMIFEAILCFVVPFIAMTLHYVVQGHRFDIIEDIGCIPNTFVSVPSLILIWIPPLVISLISMGYAIAAFHHFLKRRIEFAAVLQKSNSALSSGRYFRLMALAVFEIFWDSGVNIYVLWSTVRGGLLPWISWENVHVNFSRVRRFPQFLLPESAIINDTWTWWVVPISSIAFFAFFGFGEEAMSDYRASGDFIMRVIFRRKVNRGSAQVLPSYREIQLSGKTTLPSFSVKDTDLKDDDDAPWTKLHLNMPDMSDSSTLSSSRRDSKSNTVTPADDTSFDALRHTSFPLDPHPELPAELSTQLPDPHAS